MIVAFLDLLGFSDILNKNIETANDILIAFNESVITKIQDYNIMKKRNLNTDLFQKSFVDSFKFLISLSDSLIIGSEVPSLFVEQLCNFVATLFKEYNNSFSDKFDINDDVQSDKFASYEYGSIRYHMAFPLLFRGGISCGNSVYFFNEYQINNGEQ